MHVESVGACWSRITRASRERLAGGSSWTSSSNGCKTYIWRSPGPGEKLPESRLEDASGRLVVALHVEHLAHALVDVQFVLRVNAAKLESGVWPHAAMEGLELRLAALERSSERLC